MADQLAGAEFWLSGPVEGVPALLQPVAHALLQSRREIQLALVNFDEKFLWETPSGVASVGFHLQHIPGVINRLLTYANNQLLSPAQLKYLSEEGMNGPGTSMQILLQKLHKQVDEMINDLKQRDPETLTEARGVGRKHLPSTVIGLLFHAAEHTMRHTGQLLVTARVLVK